MVKKRSRFYLIKENKVNRIEKRVITTKIALLTTWFPPLIVGSGNRFYEIGRRLAGKHEIHVYTTGIAGSAREEELEGMLVHRYGVFDRSRSIERGSTLHNLKFTLYLLRKLRYNSFWEPPVLR